MAFLFCLGIVIMGGVMYLAVSKKSPFKVRVAALGALAVMIVSVIVCVVVYFTHAKGPQQLILPDMMPSEMPPPQSGASPVTMIMLSLFLVALFIVIFIMAMKEQRRAEGKEERPVDGW